MGDWLAGAVRVESSAGGTLVGGPPRWVWHTYEADPKRLTAVAGARALRAAGNDAHFVFNPLSGQIAQLLPASRSARTLKNVAGGVQTNRLGQVCLQVEVIGFAAHPFTSILTLAGRTGLGKLVTFARSHGIPDVWPAGPPPAYPSGSSPRRADIWTTRAGHYGHSQVPENDHGDPGAIDVRVLWAAADGLTTAPTTKIINREGPTVLYRATSDSTNPPPAGGGLVKGAVVDCHLGARWHIPASGAPLVAAHERAGLTVVGVPGQDIIDAYPVDAGQPAPVTVDVDALAAAIAARLQA